MTGDMEAMITHWSDPKTREISNEQHYEMKMQASTTDVLDDEVQASTIARPFAARQPSMTLV